jgi:hypothetical protein
MTYSKRFSSKFFAKLLQPAPGNPIRDRATSFELIFELLDQKEDKNFLIVETGCMRADHGQLAYGDDGASTFIFDDFINYYDGEVYSVDIKPENVAHAQKMVSDKTKVICSDSVKFLWNFPEDRKIDFLYLDSYDVRKDNPHPSQLHHVKELCAVIDKLDEGSIVCIDDHDAFFTGGQIGKGTYVKDFMENIGAECIHEGYQIVWVM